MLEPRPRRGRFLHFIQDEHLGYLTGIKADRLRQVQRLSGRVGGVYVRLPSIIRHHTARVRYQRPVRTDKPFLAQESSCRSEINSLL